MLGDWPSRTWTTTAVVELYATDEGTHWIPIQLCSYHGWVWEVLLRSWLAGDVHVVNVCWYTNTINTLLMWRWLSSLMPSSIIFLVCKHPDKILKLVITLCEGHLHIKSKIPTLREYIGWVILYFVLEQGIWRSQLYFTLWECSSGGTQLLIWIAVNICELVHKDLLVFMAAKSEERRLEY